MSFADPLQAQSLRHPGCNSRSGFGCQRFFLTFSPFDVPYIYEGSSRRISPMSLVDPNHQGEPLGVVDGGEMTRRTRRPVTKCSQDILTYT